MAIEAVKGSAMTFQASSTPTVRESSQQVKVEKTEVEHADQVIANSTVEISAKTNQKFQGGPDSEGQQQQKQQPTQASEEQIKKAIDEMNKKMTNSEAIFGIHDATNRITIKLVDKKTKEVIKELPPEKTLDMIAKAWEMAGLLVDEKR